MAERYIFVEQWKIVGPGTYEDAPLVPGGDIPRMTEADAKALELAGVLVKLPPPPPPVDADVESDLAAALPDDAPPPADPAPEVSEPAAADATADPPEVVPETIPAVVSAPMITPSEWWIVRSFVHGGITYSQGESVPLMTVAQADDLARSGVIIRMDGLAHQPRDLARRPESAQEFLQATDVMVLRKIRAFRPTVRELREIEQLAVHGGRSAVLIEALKTLLGDDV